MPAADPSSRVRLDRATKKLTIMIKIKKKMLNDEYRTPNFEVVP